MENEVEQGSVMNARPRQYPGQVPSALEFALWSLFLVVSIPATAVLLGYWVTSDMSAGAFQAVLFGFLVLQLAGFVRSVLYSKRLHVLITILIGLLVAGTLFMTLLALWFSLDEKPLVHTNCPALMHAFTAPAPQVLTDPFQTT